MTNRRSAGRRQIIAAESCGRQAYLLEYDPLYCDTIIIRWQGFTGRRAMLAESNISFEDIADERLSLVMEG